MKRKALIPLLAAGHGLNDLVAGYFLGQLVLLKMDMAQTAMGLFLYNLIAFGGQYPVALWIEKKSKPGDFISGAMLLNMAAIILFFKIPQLSIVLAGVASAIYHVSGGSVCARENRAADIGIFAAPGVAGLILGGYMAHEQWDIRMVLFAAAALFLFIAGYIKIPLHTPLTEHREEKKKFSLDRHDYVMIFLLVIISLRSVIWNIFQLIHENDYTWLPAIAIAACMGKIIGGWVADRIGWKLYLYLSLLTAAPLLTYFRKDMVPFCVGIGLLQSGIPATTALIIQSAGGKTERGIGLSFGLAIMAGAVALYSPVRNWLFLNSTILTIMSGIFLLLWGIGHRKLRISHFRN